MLFRLVDSIEDGDEIGEKLLEIEFTTFLVVKKAIEKEFGTWTGSQENNKKADQMISRVIRRSLLQYEKKRKSYEKTYFLFK